jgi:hypothetical protein
MSLSIGMMKFPIYMESHKIHVTKPPSSFLLGLPTVTLAVLNTPSWQRFHHSLQTVQSRLPMLSHLPALKKNDFHGKKLYFSHYEWL